MITPSFGLTATERVLPKLALDFTTASLDSRVTFTRTTNATYPATYVNSNGVITTATNNQPRFDYDSATLVCKGLLIEESRTNIITNSYDISSFFYLNPPSTVTSSTELAPDNQNVARKITKTSQINLYKNLSGLVTSGQSYSFSIYTKYVSQQWFYIQTYDNTATLRRIWFDVKNGVIGTAQSGWSGNVENAPNGFLRFKFTISSILANAFNIFSSSDNNTTSDTAVTTDTIMWGAQLEAGTFPTSYIPTTSAALTRNADVATMTGTNFSSWYNQTEGTVFSRFYATSVLGAGSSAARCSMGISVGASTNRFRAQLADATQIRFTAVSNGSVTADLYSSATSTINTWNDYVYAYKVDSFATSVNASNPSTDSSGAIPISPDRAFIGSDENTGATGYLNGWMAKVFYWPQRLTNAEVQAFAK